MSPLPKSGAVLFAKDLPRLASFYEAVARLSITVAEPDLIVLESPATQLVLHGIPSRIARTITITSPPMLRSDTAVKLVFAVASLAQARADAIRFGGALNATKKEFEARGFRACDGHDPEGNVIQFREAAS